MGASGEALPGQVRITFLEQYVAGDIRMFCLFCEWNDYDRLELASVDRIPLHDDYRSFIFWFRSF